MTDDKTPDSPETEGTLIQIFAQFVIGDVAATIWRPANGGRLLTTLEKRIHPKIVKENPQMVHTFTPQDISALRKLLKEVEDAHFSYQSVVHEAIDGSRNQTLPRTEPTKKEEEDN